MSVPPLKPVVRVASSVDDLILELHQMVSRPRRLVYPDSLEPIDKQLHSTVEHVTKNPLPAITNLEITDDIKRHATDDCRKFDKGNTNIDKNAVESAAGIDKRESEFNRSSFPRYHIETRSNVEEYWNTRNCHCPTATTFKPSRQKLNGRSVACQTSWSWLSHMHKPVQKSTTKKLRKSDTGIQAGKTEIPKQPKQILQKNPLDEIIPPIAGQETEVKAEADANQSEPKPVESETIPLLSEESGEMSNQLISESLVSIAWPSREDEYGIPIDVNLDDDDDWSFANSSVHNSDDDDESATANNKRAGETADKSPLSERFKNQKGLCKFCGKEMKPFPTLEDQANLPPEELYCCSEYREYLESLLKQEESDVISEHEHEHEHEHGKKGHKHRFKEHMHDHSPRSEGSSDAKFNSHRSHLTDRTSGAGDMNEEHCCIGNVNTINYQLSSRQCMKVGWTVRPASPIFTECLPENIEEPIQLQASFASCYKAGNTLLLQKTYNNGAPFLLIFPDGTGNVFYPSGCVAITIFSVEPGLHTLIVHEDSDRDPQVIGLFDPFGWGATYYPNGQIRVCLSPFGGIDLDGSGVKRHNWRWNNRKQRHIHAPPLYPLNVALSSSVSLHISSQFDMTLTFSSAQRACRFSVAAKRRYEPQFVGFDDFTACDDDLFDVNEQYRKNCIDRFESVLRKLSTLLRLPYVIKLPTVSSPRPLRSRIRTAVRPCAEPYRNPTVVMD